jgi:hypothetical protein
MNEAIGLVEAESEESWPLWSVSHFLDNTTSNYLKLLTLREVCRIFREGAEDRDFLIAAHSYDLFPANDDLHYDEHDLIALESKDRSAAQFWHLFKYLHRPVVLFRTRQGLSPIYEVESDASLRIKSLSLLSPFSFSLQGAIGALVDLFSGTILAQRENERNAQALANVNTAVQTSHLIEDPRTPPGVKHFAIDQLESIMNKQAKINERLGIRRPRYFR